jgi:glycosyltransferase involved in cell wall biosynthesis
VATYGAKPESVFVTYNSPDTDELFEARAYIANLPTILPPNPHRILHVGRLVKWKRVDLLIDALARILPSIPDAELVVIGTGPEMTTLQDQAKRLDIERHVKFVGGVYKLTDLGRYLNESALYVLAGMGGLSINEAMAFGKPVVCSVCDGTEKHLVREGINGRYFTHGDVVSLAEVINDIITDPLTLTQMGEASTAIIRDEIHIGTVIDGYKKAFQYVIKLG